MTAHHNCAILVDSFCITTCFQSHTGTHSAVKICRWTKNQLRGRGGCYKHSFYGITSYQCMEATPSLACANKCVFCWRHHKNPVGTEWRWKEDAPDMIVSEAVRLHQGKACEYIC